MNSSYTPCLSTMNLPSISYLNIIKFKTINDAYIYEKNLISIKKLSF